LELWGDNAMTAWNLARIEQAFADAALDPSRWNAAMEVTSDVTEGAGAALFPIQGRLPFVPQSPRMAASFESYIRDDWISRDERYRACPIIIRKGVATDFDYTTSNEMDRHPFFQEFLAPHGLRWFAGVLVAAGDDKWALSIQRSILQGPFSPREQKELAKLSPRLSSAAALARALGFSAANTTLEAFEISGTAIVLFNRLGEPIKLNRQAERMLGSGIRVSKRRIVADTRDGTDALDRALHTLIWTKSGSALLPPVVLPRDGRQPLLAYPLRLSSVSANVFAECQALLLLVDPETHHHAPEATMQTAFGLTAAEARLASKLASGQALEKASTMLGIAKETARHHLKSIFAKTNTHRQAELVALMASLVGQFSGP
jgi:DNA-binding CsgD family transcriptional regulator/PAS domain-containing protein